MSKNLIPQIAAMLGLQLGEEFKVKGYEELTCRFASDGLKLTYDNGLEISGSTAKVTLVALLNGKDEIVKLPWKPKNGQGYYTFGTSVGKRWMIWQQLWNNHPVDLALLDKGWIYRTRAEAEAALPAVAKEMGVEFMV